MIEIIKEPYTEYTEYYTLDYERKDDIGCDFTFPCDKSGVIKNLNPAAAESLQFCKDHLEYFHEPRVIKHKDSYRHGITGKCHCGQIFELESHYMGACSCPKCDQWYNLFGQELNPPATWEEDDCSYY